MTYDYVVDSYAWIEYFSGSVKGEGARRYIEDEDSATPTIVIAEVSGKLMREIASGRETVDGRLTRLGFLKSSTTIADLTEEIALRSGEIDAERKEKVRRWGLADSVVLATARIAGAKVVTGDRHFQDLKEETVYLS
jgi:predicted nucleic acid-binding protein